MVTIISKIRNCKDISSYNNITVAVTAAWTSFVNLFPSFFTTTSVSFIAAFQTQVFVANFSSASFYLYALGAWSRRIHVCVTLFALAYVVFVPVFTIGKLVASDISATVVCNRLTTKTIV